jgi:type VI secretion system secreted protein Hcp
MASDNFLWFPAAATGGLLTGKATQPTGESTDNWMGMSSSYKAMEIKSFSFGVAQAETSGSATGGASAGKAKFEEFSIEKFVDQASVPIYNACTAGAHFPSVMLAIRKSGGSNLLYLQYIFRQVFVTSIGWSGGGGEESPSETIKFKFGAMGIQYVRQKADGTGDSPVQGMWNQIANNPTLNVTGLPGPPQFLTASQS